MIYTLIGVGLVLLLFNKYGRFVIGSVLIWALGSYAIIIVIFYIIAKLIKGIL